jgi:hypothetical protein
MTFGWPRSDLVRLPRATASLPMNTSPHCAIMALGTESRSEIDVRTTFGRLFGAGVDLGDMRGGIDGRPR